MITKENFKEALKTLGFEENNEILTKTLNNATLKVDVKAQKLIYPSDLVINDKTTCNFSQPENFVVFECVHRLLNQGYFSKHLELERKWQLGRELKSGKADICIKNNENKIICIIECKTPDNKESKEYSKAKNLLETSPYNQLFSYYKQAEPDFLVLYTSEFLDNQILNTYLLIPMLDDIEYLKKHQLKGYDDLRKDENARKEAQDYYSVWDNTYKKTHYPYGLFENNQAYNIGQGKPTLEILEPINENDLKSKYHEFATILRQHNVSGRENAFDKLINLLLCKVSDEKNNSTKDKENQELQFFWKGFIVDEPLKFCDRLQQLYQQGMKEFLNEDITYISEEQIEEAFKLFKNKKNETKDTIKEYFTQLKYYSSNDFAFIDVHNEELFKKNFEVLLKMVKLFQNNKLLESHENQFLSDLFEGFLDNGIKQSEGQFFTPLVIVKFIINSLPHLDKPKVLDYACGAGHFLNEYYKINPKASIVGIEKEYRLSKVAKVSSFMYGANSKIIYNDALKVHKDLKDFNVLIANPPYSVKGFLSTLNESERQNFSLYANCDEKSLESINAIECFFIERATQLLEHNALAGIILPSSILSKDTPILYTKTRELILKHFKIIAMVEFGSTTFGKTGTNTITLFLKKKSNTPKEHKHFENLVNAWFEGDFSTNDILIGQDYLNAYCSYRNFNEQDYRAFLQDVLKESLKENENFKEYTKAFNALYKEPKSKVKELNKEQQLALKEKELIKFIKLKEQEKLLYFCIAYNQQERVLIVKSPSKNEEAKKFLGYEWSSRKGSEGIKYLNSQNTNNDDEILENQEELKYEGLKNINTPLYNPNDLNDKTKINTLIKSNFNHEILEIPSELKEFVRYANLVDLLDFERLEFNKALNLNPKNKVEIKSKYELVRLGEVISELVRGITYPKTAQSIEPTKNIVLPADNITLEGILELNKPIYLNGNFKMEEIKRLKANDIFMCFSSGSLNHLGKVAFIENDTPYYAGGFMGIIRINENKAKTKFVFYMFNSILKQSIQDLSVGSNINNLSSKIQTLKIPLPPLEIQEQILSHLQELDTKREVSQTKINALQQEITNIINNINAPLITLKNIAEVKGGKRIPKGEDFSTQKTPYPYIRVSDFKNNSVDMSNLKYISQSIFEQIKNYTISTKDIYISIAGTIGLVGIIPNELDNKSLTENAGKIVLHDYNEVTQKYLLYVLQSKQVKKQIIERTHAVGVPKLALTRIQTIEIPLLPLELQQEIINQIEILEKEIKTLQDELNTIAPQKERYLKEQLGLE
ncbi:restriction endonuclease subunit S [Helicobacter cetorum]|uniref:restriction endonuclease subunit S n=1 Tax=Helicobacter cetorum TaxID=138563 RepID=UPI000CF0E5EA|nr:restriction endonuclease subunit S [Helicobacter cetorum]